MKLKIRQISPQLSTNEQRSCIGKIRYNNLKALRNFIKDLKRRHRVQVQGFNNDIYHCQFCDGWHHGNKPLEKVII